jgi:hypothetical protein
MESIVDDPHGGINRRGFPRWNQLLLKHLMDVGFPKNINI